MSTAALAPEWLTAREIALCPCGCIGKRRKANFVEKTIIGAANVLKQAMFSADVASQPGLLQRIQPAVKVVTMLALLMATAVVRHLSILVALYAATLAIAVASGLPLWFFVKRVWLFIPIFTGVIVVPATLNLITPGRVVIPLGTWFGHSVGVTAQGLTSAGLIVARVATSISLVVLLTLTTPWNKLLAALRTMRVPKMFVLVLGMAYRYIFYLLETVTDMYTARKSRTANHRNNTSSGRAFVAATAGATFGKAHALSIEVHDAMVARGYTGNARSIDHFQIVKRDVVWVLACSVTIAATLGVNYALGS